MQKLQVPSGITRRSFLKTSAVLGGVAAAGSTMTALAADYEIGQRETSEEKLVRGVCRPNCFGFCNINLHVRDGRVVKTSKRQLPITNHYSRICQRGLSHVERIYAAERLQYPMRRVEGTERGAMQWERITWDEAITEIAEKIQSIQAQYGPQAVAFYSATGNYGTLVSNMGSRFVNAVNGTTISACNDLAPYLGQARLNGSGVDVNEITDVLNAKTIMAWGANVTDSQVHHWHFIKEAMQNGTKLVVIDPLFTPLAGKADYFVSVKPGTDALVYFAIMNLIIERGVVDYDFMSQYTVAPFLVRQDTGTYLRKSFVDAAAGLDTQEVSASGDGSKTAGDGLVSFAAGVTAEEDPYMLLQDGELVDVFAATTPSLEGEIEVGGVKCRTAYSMLLDNIVEYPPARVAEIADITTEQIEKLADYCIDGPVYHLMGYGLANQYGGVQTAIIGQTMAAMTGNWGKPGATFGSSYPTFLFVDWMFPYVNFAATSASIQEVDLKFVVETGKFGDLDYPIKMLYFYCANPVCTSPGSNSYLDVVYPAMDFVVTVDSVMTDTARWSDMVLPCAQHFEYTDLVVNGTQFQISMSERAIDPPYECKCDADIFRLLADKLGVGQYFTMTDEEVLKAVLENDYSKMMGWTIDNVRQNDYLRWQQMETYIAYPQGTPFATTSGRMEFYTENPAPRAAASIQPTAEEYAAERLPHFVKPRETWFADGGTAKYPIAITSCRGRFRVHSQYHTVTMLNELQEGPTAFVNPADAEARGIKNGDLVEAYNDHGHCVFKAVLNEGVRPGVLSYQKGWQRAQHVAGSWNELLYPEYEPFAIANNFQDSACELRLWKGSEE